MARRPTWHKVYWDLRNQILAGALPAGHRLPSDNELAACYQLSPMTARKGMARLASEGLITRHIGSGSYVAETTGAQAPSALDSVAVVVLDLHAAAQTQGQLDCALRGLRQTLPQDRYRIDVVSYQAHQAAALEPLLTPQRVSAVVFCGIADEDRQGIVRRLQARGLAVVMAGGRFDLGCPTVRLDRLGLVDQAVRLAIEAGHRHLGLLLYDGDDLDALRGRAQAVLTACGCGDATVALSVVPERLRPGEPPTIPDWRTGDTPPTCLIVGDETLVKGVLLAEGLAGREPPSLIALTDNTPAAWPFTVCAPDSLTLQTSLFAEAGRQVLAALRDPAAVAEPIVVRGAFQTGASLRPGPFPPIPAGTLATATV